MKVKSIFDNTFDEINGVSVAIGRLDKRRRQQHTGIYYRSSNGTPKFLHLAWHYKLRNEEPQDEYLWLDSILDPINQTHLATICQLIFDSNVDGIPYGICIEGTDFARNGKFTAEEQHAGLTCATFVIQVFHSQGFRIIDFDKWKHRQSDKKWQRQILQTLELGVARGKVLKEHIRDQRKKMQEGAARFKPEEAAVAIALPNPPHGVEALKIPANKLLTLIISHADKITKLRSSGGR